MNLKNKLEPAIIWKLVTCQRITSKRYSTSMGQHLSPRYGQVILVSGYPVLTAVNWSQHWCAICVQYQSSCAPRLARKCEIEHWFSCGADGRAGGQAVYCLVITKFSGMGRFTYPWCSAGALRAPELRYYYWKLDQGLTGGHVKWTLAAPHISKLEISAFSLYLTAALLENYLKKTILIDK